MGLIKCPDCGKEISDKAVMCIGCGYPLQEMISKTQEQDVDLIQKQKEEELRLRIEEAKRRKEKEKQEQNADIAKQYYCENCHTQNPVYSKCCKKCGEEFGRSAIIAKSKTKIEDNSGNTWSPLFKNEQPTTSNPNFKGVYRYYLGRKQEVYCPRCKSENCSHYKEQKVINGKSHYSLNLNPLKPFTVMNKKDRTKYVTEDKFLCNDCGMIFK